MAKQNIIFDFNKINEENVKLKQEYLSILNEYKAQYLYDISKSKKIKEHISIKRTYRKKCNLARKDYLNKKLLVKKQNAIVLEKEQYDQYLAKKALETHGLSKLFEFIKLNKNQRKCYKILKNREFALINNKKKNFNKLNAFEIDHFNFFYGKQQALFDINMKIKKNNVIAFIGPSGCGKSTLLRCLNRMNDQIANTNSTGNIYFNDGTNIRSKKLNTLTLTTKVGMVFQKATVFPMSIYDNVAYGPKNHGIIEKQILNQIVYDALKSAALWDEVKNKLNSPASALSGGQQQRLCIARAIALHPEVILMDESTSGLDPIATSKIESLIIQLKEKYTIIIVTHSMAQAQRVSDYTAFFNKGRLEEFGTTKQIFLNPTNKKTKDYISGRLN